MSRGREREQLRITLGVLVNKPGDWQTPEEIWGLLIREPRTVDHPRLGPLPEILASADGKSRHLGREEVRVGGLISHSPKEHQLIIVSTNLRSQRSSDFAAIRWVSSPRPGSSD